MNLPDLNIKKTFAHYSHPVFFAQDNKIVYRNPAAERFGEDDTRIFEQSLSALSPSGKAQLTWQGIVFSVTAQNFPDGTLYLFNAISPNTETDLTANLSNRLRHHISNLSAASEMLEQKLEQANMTDSTKNQVAVLNKSTCALFRLTKQLELFGGDFSTQYPKNTLNFSNLCEEIAKDFTPLAKDLSRKFHCTIAQRNLILYSSETLLKQLLISLLSNAIKFSPNDGTISFSLEKRETFLSIAISNEGDILTQDDLSRFFAPIIHEGIPVSSLGLGIDAYIIHRIVTYLGGNISASPRETGGLLCTLTIPIFPPDSNLPSLSLDNPNPFFRMEEPKISGFLSFEDTHALLIGLSEVLPMSCFERLL